MTNSSQTPKRIYSLDVLRGAASLGIVLFHWNFLYYPFNNSGAVSKIEDLPLFSLLYIFYLNGDATVKMFFCISGFIFFLLYSNKIYEQSISFASFSILRLSRLYPLHLITLLLVACGQLVFLSFSDSSYVFSFNDIYHFLLNLTFSSAWGLEKGLSFNGPIWSVSVEILLYCLFFVFCRIFNSNALAVILLASAGYFVQRFSNSIGGGIMYFFLGGLVSIIYSKIISNGDNWKVTIWLPRLAFVTWLIVLLGAHPTHGFTFSWAPWYVMKSLKYAIVILFPLTILSLALLENSMDSLWKKVSVLGDISYSSYLLHFPLMLATVLTTRFLGMDQGILISPWFMALFFFVLILLSLASHSLIEMPMQRYLRSTFRSKFNS